MGGLAALIFGIAVGAPRNQSGYDFTHDVAPILKAHCWRCHSGPDAAAKLDLTTIASIRASGVIGPSRRLIKRLRGEGGASMPMNAAPLNPDDIRLIDRWIDAGAVDITPGRALIHWAYVPPAPPAIPNFSNNSWVRNPIDAFVLRKLQSEHLTPSPEADRVTLIRRLTLDLTGRPPSLAEVDGFLADSSPRAYETVVNRLLSSPHYGERMALPWLDAARYADSNGFQMDGDTFQYVWRDWVVRAFNEDMPFDIFTIDQLAGDLLPNPTQDQLVATAFNRNHMLNGEGGAIPEEQRSVNLFDRVDTTATTWLGVTMACARCHDHKYDPFTQRDYYSLMAYFNNVPESGIVGTTGHYDIAEPWIFAGTPGQMAELERAREASATADRDVSLLATDRSAEERWASSLPATERGADATKLHALYLEKGLKPAKDRAMAAHKQQSALESEVPRVMVMSDAKPRATHVFSRGNYMMPGAEVHPLPPACLSSGVTPAAQPNRLGLARWLVDPKNPLTARVAVNRIWQQFFGLGLVKTTENFGVQSEAPIHQDLLDWLAVRFERDWDVKSLVQTIVTSSTYRQSSKRSKALAVRDPENRLLARGARFRLPSMIIRDVALVASGLMNPTVGGRPVYPYQPEGIWDSLDITDERSFKYPQSHGSELYRPSIYTFWRRTIAPGDMFDSATRQTCTVKLSVTSTPLHALTTLNDVAWNEAARKLAERAMTAEESSDARLTMAFRLVCSRRPSLGELAVLRRSLARAFTDFKAHPGRAKAFLAQGESPRNLNLDPVAHAAYSSVCLAIFNLDEALTRE